MRKAAGNCGRACTSCQASSIGKKFMSRFVEAVIGETGFILEKHLSHGYFPHAKAHVVAGLLPNPLTAEPRAPITGRPVRIGYLGVLDAVKGLDTLASALNALDSSLQPEVLIAGTAKSAYARELPQKFPAATRFLGWVRPDDLFGMIDVLVVPSLFEEPFGRVIIEAFAAGIPVIGARSGGIPETIEPGVNGFLFPAGDVDALAELLARLAKDPGLIATLSSGAIEAAKRYTPDRIGSAYNAVFAELSQHKQSVSALQGAQT